jgi:hypothetical protein
MSGFYRAGADDANRHRVSRCRQLDPPSAIDRQMWHFRVTTVPSENSAPSNRLIELPPPFENRLLQLRIREILRAYRWNTACLRKQRCLEA